MEGSTLGGIVGKTLLLVLLNSFMKGVVIQTRGQGGRRRNFWNQFKANASNALLTRIPQFFNMKKLWNAGSVTAVGIPLSLDGGEDLDWHFIPTVICPQGLRAVAPTVAGAGGDRTLVLGLTGAPMRTPHAELFITVVAWAMGPDGQLYKTTATAEMKLHRPGIEARRTADGKLEVTCYTNSNLNGIAETRKLGPEEYRNGTDPDTGKCTVTARDPKLGSCTVEE